MENKTEISMEDVEKLDSLPPEAKEEKAVDPAQVEKDLVEEEQKRLNAAAERDPAEVATMLLGVYTPRFKGLVSKLSNRQLKRLVSSLVEYPLEEYQHNDKIEKEAFYIGCGLLDAKFALIQHTYNENREKIMADAKAAADSATMEFSREVPNEQTATKEGN